MRTLINRQTYDKNIRKCTTIRIRSIFKTLASLYSSNRPLDILDVLGSNFRPTNVHFERCKFVNL